MELQIRNSQDPFTQTLVFLFRTTKNEFELRRKVRADIVPLVTQVAVKIGSIGTEQSVRDQALPVFTGTISLYLASVVSGRKCDVIEEWAKQVTTNDLGTLFRKGYTLIDELVRNTGANRDGGRYLEVKTFAERIREYTTHIENGVWAGFDLYQNRLTAYADKKMLDEFASWLFLKAGTPTRKSVCEANGDFDIAETMVSRVLVGVLHSGKISSVLNLKKVRAIVRAARGNPKWWARAQKHYASFVKNIPEKFRKCLDRTDSEVTKSVVLALGLAKSLVDGKMSRDESVDRVCLDAGLNPPGLTEKVK